MQWQLGAKFGQIEAHHANAKALWEGKWKKTCTQGVYPFNRYSRTEDFQAVFDVLIKDDINDAYSDEWTEAFMPLIQELEQKGNEVGNQDKKDLASDYYLRAATLAGMARFPMINSPLKRKVWDTQKRLYLAGSSTWPVPFEDVQIPHAHATSADGATVQMFVKRPPPADEEKSTKQPVLLYITGLDGYRTDALLPVMDFLDSRGVVSVIVEIAGCGDSPAAPNDPESPDRFYATVLDWIEAQAWADGEKVFVWGTSTGGFDAVRLAHVHKERVKGVVAHGGATHFAWGREWLDGADGGEYPFPITPALMTKFGYNDIESLKADAQKRFSLLNSGLLDKPCARLILLNGMDDSIFPIEDSLLLLEHGSIKESRFFPGLGHMGFPVVFNPLMDVFKVFFPLSS